ncbi:hypothetical protein OFY17_14595 [Marinomonas sp. C2222]|uniref:Uracil DNA glycosylase superfamily protein n=1 Tax=Marinomonas sargassi TaxID=2984494 RepID=A0ABT2YW26_9GAMM|nr:hypothetical protein [Marinomonas sargassi]MCV2404092.1 hypothetical protein [Marinomonas sargassi]
MSRELSTEQAFQTHCLAQMGVVSWLSAPQGVSGSVFMPAQPWVIESHTSSALDLSEVPEDFGFEPVITKPEVTLAPEEKQQSVHNLREQLNAGPEIIVEDMQPIEELAVDIEVEPEVVASGGITKVDLHGYALSNRLLILTDVPQIFSQAEEVERLALKMGQALLKSSIDEWHGSAFSWPGALKNPHFLDRSDWLVGALESYVLRLSKEFPEPPLLVLAGEKVSILVSGLPENSPLKQYPTARIQSLPELYRIPELRKEAWDVMQANLFR